jgi:hypothetical protein
MTRNLLNLQNVKFMGDNTTLTFGKEVMAIAQQELDNWQACSKVSGGTLNHDVTASWVVEQVLRSLETVDWKVIARNPEFGGWRRCPSSNQGVEAEWGAQNLVGAHHLWPFVEDTGHPIDRAGNSLNSQGQNVQA